MAHVAIVTNRFREDSADAYERLTVAATRCLGQRHQISVLTAESNHRQSPSGEWPGTVQATLFLMAAWSDASYASEVRRFTTSLRNYAAASAFFREVRPDKVFFWNLRQLGLGPLHAALDMGLPVFLSVNDHYPLQYAERHLLASAADIGSLNRWPSFATMRVTATSHFLVRELLRGRLELPAVKVIYPGVEFAQGSDCRFPCRPGARLRLLAVGDVSTDGGQETVVEALGLLSDDAIQLTVVGAGESEVLAGLRQRADALGVTSQIEWRQPLPENQLQQVMDAHDALVVPTRWPEPLDVTYLKAIASGLHLVCTPVGPVQELITAGMYATTFAPGDAVGLAEGIRQIAAADEDLLAQARSATQLARDYYSFDRYCDELLAFLGD